MANPNIPNLCGANPNLNGALSKIEELKDKLLSNIDVDASTLKSELEEGLDELKSAFDKLEVELPEAPAVNLQAEITSLINDIDKTSIAGITAFNAKLATLKLDFGNALEEKGIDFDELIASAETKLAGGGNVCDLVSNLEIPAGNSGSGITTETKEERGSGTSITLTETPKSIVSVQGQKTGTNFFSSITYKQLGRAISTSEQDADGNVISYAVIKVTYIVDLIKEKPIAAKQADKDGEKEEPSIVSKNTKSIEKNAEAKVQALSKQINDKTAAGVSTDDIQKAFDNLFATLESEEFKTQMKSDFESAQAEFSKIAQDPLKYKTITIPQGNASSVSPVSDDEPLELSFGTLDGSKFTPKKTRTIEAVTTEDRNTTTQVQTKVTTDTSETTTVTKTKTEKTVVAKKGFVNRKVRITEDFIRASRREDLVENVRVGFKKPKFKNIESAEKFKLKRKPFEIIKVLAYTYHPLDYEQIITPYFSVTDRATFRPITPVIVDDTNEVILTSEIVNVVDEVDSLSIADIDVIKIEYTSLENIDPNFKG